MKNIMQMLGLRSDCCNAKIIAWHHDKHYCENCERWLDKPAETAGTAVSGAQKPSSRTHLID